MVRARDAPAQADGARAGATEISNKLAQPLMPRRSGNAGEPPWASGPKEILKHGLVLLREDTDANRRLAMLSIDNAVELIAKTFLLSQRLFTITNSLLKLINKFQKSAAKTGSNPVRDTQITLNNSNKNIVSRFTFMSYPFESPCIKYIHSSKSNVMHNFLEI